MKRTHYLACDLGGESGRVILGTLEDQKLTIEELHRFSHAAIRVNDSWRWDVDKIVSELKTGLKKGANLGHEIASISTDSWGVDYVLLGENGQMLDRPHCYRDTRTSAIFKRLQSAPLTNSLLYRETGIQAMPFNTIYQLVAEAEQNAGALRECSKFLFIADYLNYLLSGRQIVEASLASTSQLYNPVSKQWSLTLIKEMNLRPGIFPEICPSATVLGPLIGELATEPGLKTTQVAATCSHDTGAAVVGVPGEGSGWAYLSSGTWSLLGMEATNAVISDRSQSLNFTNEVGYGGTIRLLTNISGLWLLQECRRAWSEAGTSYNYQELVNLASHHQGDVPLINPNWSEFSTMGSMPEKISRYCEQSHQPRPASIGEYVRTVLESLALLYARVLEELEVLNGSKFERLHIVGGGSQNGLLNQMTANAIRRPVIAGPVEGSAIGNLLLQALSMGHVTSLAHIRQIVRNSFPTKTYEPQAGTTWDKKRSRFQAAYLRN